MHIFSFSHRRSGRRRAAVTEGTVRPPQVPSPARPRLLSHAPPRPPYDRSASMHALHVYTRVSLAFIACHLAPQRAPWPISPNPSLTYKGAQRHRNLDLARPVLGAGRPRPGGSIVLPRWEGGEVPRDVRWGRVGERQDAKRVIVSRVPRGQNGHISQLFCTFCTVWHVSMCLELLVMLVRSV